MGNRLLVAPTAKHPRGDSTVPDHAVTPHGETWTRGAPPIDSNTYASPSALDVVAESKTRHSDDRGDGTGVGRRASGFLLLAGGTVTIVTGTGQTNTFNGATLPQGFFCSCEFTTITSSDATGVVVFW